MQTISFKHKYGIFEGQYASAGTKAPLVVVINGHNGFYNYGMFPEIQRTLQNNNIASYSFNFSHGGVIGDADFFEDLDKYEKNCMRLEVEDVLCVLQNAMTGQLENHREIFLLAHSLGGVPAIFGATKAKVKNINVNGIILLSTVAGLNFWPKEMIREWERDKVYHKKNNRTKQMLPQGEEFLNEVLESDSKWNIEKEIKKLDCPFLIIHGETDEAVPVDHSYLKYNWIKQNEKSSLKIIPGATHTFNTKHPFEGASPQLEEALQEVVSFINAVAI